MTDLFVFLYSFRMASLFVIDMMGLPKVFCKTHTVQRNKMSVVNVFNIASTVNIFDAVKLA